MQQRDNIIGQHLIDMGANKSLCLDPETKAPTHAWCFYQAFDNYTIIVQIAFEISLFVTVAILYKYFRILRRIYLKKEIRHMIMSSTTMQVFMLIIAWVIGSMIKGAINLVVYFVYMQPDFEAHQMIFKQEQERASWEPIVILSPIFNFIDYICGFLILFLMLMVPYKWYKLNQYYRLKATLLTISERKQTQIDFEVRVKIQRIFKILKAFKIYNKTSLVLMFIFLVLQPFIMYFTPIQCEVYSYKYILFITDSYSTILYYLQIVLILVFYFFGIYVTYFVKKYKLNRLKNKELNKIKFEYYLLMMVLIIKLVINFYFKFTSQYIYRPNRNCSDVNTQDKVQATVYTIFGALIQYFPLIVTVYIYKPNEDFLKSYNKLSNITIQRSFRQGSTHGVFQPGGWYSGLEGDLFNNQSRGQQYHVFDKQSLADKIFAEEFMPSRESQRRRGEFKSGYLKSNNPGLDENSQRQKNKQKQKSTNFQSKNKQIKQKSQIHESLW